jgi:hypothetical protein
MKWLFLVHQIQTRNSRERVKVWRLTKKVGAILYRNSVYVLPNNRERLEDFQWLCQQIRDSKGEASVFVSEAGSPDEGRQLRKLFEETREKEFTSLYEESQKLLGRMTRSPGQPPLTSEQTTRLRKEHDQLHESFINLMHIDFFSSPTAKKVRTTLGQISSRFEVTQYSPQPLVKIGTYNRKAYYNRVWATRERIHIDRLCSAWLIRRFIDPKAKFAFAAETKLPKGSIPFDILGVEFGHHGDDCTFETLLKSFRISDTGLEQIAEIVHDIDLKDKKFNRPEADGINVVVRSLSDSLQNDHKALEIGSVLLDALYRRFTSNKKPKA